MRHKDKQEWERVQVDNKFLGNRGRMAAESIAGALLDKRRRH